MYQFNDKTTINILFTMSILWNNMGSTGLRKQPLSGITQNPYLPFLSLCCSESLLGFALFYVPGFIHLLISSSFLIFSENAWLLILQLLKVYFKYMELAHRIMKAEESQDPQLASWKSGRANGVVPVQIQKSENQKSQSYKVQSKSQVHSRFKIYFSLKADEEHVPG